mmetsp:Transcript_10550/g.15853  ORF Transcript_10550/g.15853 Transcript_10550/m.15853 type:complete len:378 (+) Transcript_10550:2-1135(+)
MFYLVWVYFTAQALIEMVLASWIGRWYFFTPDEESNERKHGVSLMGTTLNDALTPVVCVLKSFGTALGIGGIGVLVVIVQQCADTLEAIYNWIELKRARYTGMFGFLNIYTLFKLPLFLVKSIFMGLAYFLRMFSQICSSYAGLLGTNLAQTSQYAWEMFSNTPALSTFTSISVPWCLTHLVSIPVMLGMVTYGAPLMISTFNDLAAQFYKQESTIDPQLLQSDPFLLLTLALLTQTLAQQVACAARSVVLCAFEEQYTFPIPVCTHLSRTRSLSKSLRRYMQKTEAHSWTWLLPVLMFFGYCIMFVLGCVMWNVISLLSTEETSGGLLQLISVPGNERGGFSLLHGVVFTLISMRYIMKLKQTNPIHSKRRKQLKF